MITPRAMAADHTLERYLFAYFTGDTRDGENIFLAVSDGNDALHWRPLNGGHPVFVSRRGTTGLRDPFLFRRCADEGFVLMATDLAIGAGTTWTDAMNRGSRHIEVWTSFDLVEWSEQRHVELAPQGAGCAWAPEAAWDPFRQAYRVIWTSTRNRGDGAAGRLGVWTSVTSDFEGFSPPELWIERPSSVLDATLLRHAGSWHRFLKDDGSQTACSGIVHERSSRADALGARDAWIEVSRCIGLRDGVGPLEGPIAFRANPGDVNGDVTYLFVDEFGGGRGYLPLVGASLDEPDWRLASSFTMPPGARHGSVLALTAAEAERVEGAFP
jgi:hypothetical protein